MRVSEMICAEVSPDITLCGWLPGSKHQLTCAEVTQPMLLTGRKNPITNLVSNYKKVSFDGSTYKIINDQCLYQ